MHFAHHCSSGYGAWMGARWGRRGPHVHPLSRWFEIFGEPSPRAERGEVRYLVLDAVANAPRHGYEIMQFIESRSGGSYRPSPGVVYPTLQLLEEMLHVRGADQDGRKVYSITEEGRRDLDQHRHLVDEFYDRFEDQPWEAHAEEVAQLAQRFARLVKAFRRATRHGHVGPSTMRAVHRIFDEALEKMERVLREGPDAE